MLKTGIVGLPNVGKSTLFNALLKKQVADVANYPFCTIEPNVGVIEVPDPRLDVLAKIVKTSKIVPAAVEFYDIAGLVKGASTGEGLGNKFLSHIKETDMIIHVVRLFEDSSVTHVEESPEALKDIQIIETELMLADVSLLDRQKEPKGKVSKDEAFTWDTMMKLKKALDSGLPARSVDLTQEEEDAVKKCNLLTQKPVLYVFNVSESQLKNYQETEKKCRAFVDDLHSTTPDKTENKPLFTIVSAKLEADLVVLSEEEQAEYLREYGLAETGLNRIITESYKLLDLISFLTAGEIEARAWPVKRGTMAPQAAGVIHTDFEKHFIKVEVVKYKDFVEVGGWNGAREKGKILLGGKDYVMKDGDVVFFKVRV